MKQNTEHRCSDARVALVEQNGAPLAGRDVRLPIDLRDRKGAGT